MEEILARAREIFAADHYATSLTGIQIEQIGLHEAQCSLDLAPQHLNARGVAMGGVLFTLADFCAAVAANSGCLEEDVLHWVSVNSSIHFLAPAQGGRLMAFCRAIKHGRSTALYQTEIIVSTHGKLIATVETTLMTV